MTTINFPAGAAVDDYYSFGGKTWKKNATGWILLNSYTGLVQGAAAKSVPATTDLIGLVDSENGYILKSLSINNLANWLASAAQTLSNKTVNTIAGGLNILNSGVGAFNMNVAHNGTLTANRTLTFNVNNVARTVSLSGNLTLGGSFTTSGSSAVTFSVSGTTALTLPTTGTLATLSGSELFVGKTLTTPILSASTSTTAGALGYTGGQAYIGNGSAALVFATTTGAQNLSDKTLLAPIITGYVETVVDMGTGSAFSPNLTNGTSFRVTTNANTSIALPLAVAGKSYSIEVVYGGAHTVSFTGGTVIAWAPNGAAPAATSATGKRDMYVFVCTTTSYTKASDAGRNY